MFMWSAWPPYSTNMIGHRPRLRHSFDPVSLVWSDQSPHDRAAPTKRLLGQFLTFLLEGLHVNEPGQVRFVFLFGYLDPIGMQYGC